MSEPKWEANNKGYKQFKDSKELLHRWVFRSKIGLSRDDLKKSGFVVHHVDGNKINNDISNLALLKQEAHNKLHYTQWNMERLIHVMSLIIIMSFGSSMLFLLTKKIMYEYIAFGFLLIGVSLKMVGNKRIYTYLKNNKIIEKMNKKKNGEID